MTNHSPERRRFLVAAITFTGAALAAPSVLVSSKAWAGGKRNALVHLTRLLYPHDSVDDAVYAEVLDQAMGMIAEGQGFEKMLEEVSQQLDESLGGNFLAASPEAQSAALEAIQDQPYFGAIHGAVANRLYSNTGTWSMLNYEGPSYRKGGYIDRGAGDIDWLPEMNS